VTSRRCLAARQPSTFRRFLLKTISKTRLFRQIPDRGYHPSFPTKPSPRESAKMFIIKFKSSHYVTGVFSLFKKKTEHVSHTLKIYSVSVCKYESVGFPFVINCLAYKYKLRSFNIIFTNETYALGKVIPTVKEK